MAQVETRARKTLRRIGVARANLAFLQQPDRAQLAPIYGRFAQRYRIGMGVLSRTRALDAITPDDCASAIALHLDGLTNDASAISGINRVESELLNEHLRVLVYDCQAFTPAQELGTDAGAAVTQALGRFLARDMGTGTFAGSALEPAH